MESTPARDLDRRLADLVRSERHLVVQFVLELAGFARQELYRELGYTSLFSYCVRQLGLSKSSAFRRAEAARLIARFPVIADRLAAGRVSIRALVELREVLTEENHAGLLIKAEGLSQEAAQLLAVAIKPRHVPRDVVRTLVSAGTRLPAQRPDPSAPTDPSARSGPSAASGPSASSGWEASSAPPALPDAVPGETRNQSWPAVVDASRDQPGPAEVASPRRQPARVKPLTPELRRLSVTVSAEFVGELELVRAALSHSCPDGDFEMVVRAAFKLVLERDRKRKALTGRARAAQQPPQPSRPEPTHQQLPTLPPSHPPLQPPSSPSRQPAQPPSSPPQPPQSPQQQPPSRQPPQSSSSPLRQPSSPPAPFQRRPAQGPGRKNERYVPAAVKRAVWERDRGRCTWPMGDGNLCGSTHRLELDHDLEVALGGKSTFENMRLLCRSHNLMKAERHLGRALMAKFRRSRPIERDSC